MPLDLASDAAVYVADFAESIVYRPLSGIPRTIQALVTRGSPESMQPHGVAPRFTIMVRNNHRYGIASDEIDTGGDCVDAVGFEPPGLPEIHVPGHDAVVIVLVLDQQADIQETGHV
mgnify:CR=1 FL=1